MVPAMTLSDLMPRLHYPTRLEKLVDGWVHGVSLGLFTFAVGVCLGLAIWQGGLGMASAIAIYAVCVIVMIGCSMAYNLAENHKRKALLRRFDHAAIFLMIAGTYTPFTLLRIRPFWDVALTTTVWSIAAAGIALRLLSPRVFDRVSVGFYLALGWAGLAAIAPLVPSVQVSTLVLLGAGGLLYSAGVVFHLWERLPFQNAIWHAFVLVGASVHYAAVLEEIVVSRAGG